MDHPLSKKQEAALKAYIARPKFAPDGFYVGFLSKDVISDPDKPLNDLAHGLLQQGHFNKNRFLDDAIETYHKNYDIADTEDRERVLSSIEDLMDILGIESSDGRLNEAMYGTSH